MLKKSIEEKLVCKFSNAIRPDAERVSAMTVYLDYCERYLKQGDRFKGNWTRIIDKFDVHIGLYDDSHALFNIVELDDPEYQPFYIFHCRGEYQCFTTPNLPESWSPPINKDIYNALRDRGNETPFILMFEFDTLRELCHLICTFEPDWLRLGVDRLSADLTKDLLAHYDFQDLSALCDVTYKHYKHLLDDTPSHISDQVFIELYKAVSGKLDEYKTARQTLGKWKPITI